MAKERGWWKISYSPVDSDHFLEPNDSDLEHIAELIKDGYIEGEIVKDEEQ